MCDLFFIRRPLFSLSQAAARSVRKCCGASSIVGVGKGLCMQRTRILYGELQAHKVANVLRGMIGNCAESSMDQSAMKIAGNSLEALVVSGKCSPIDGGCRLLSFP